MVLKIKYVAKIGKYTAAREIFKNYAKNKICTVLFKIFFHYLQTFTLTFTKNDIYASCSRDPCLHVYCNDYR